jgi:hypothetical protein
MLQARPEVEDGEKGGLMGLGGRETRIDSTEHSKLSDADRIPKMKEELEGIIEEKAEEPIPKVDREREFLSDKTGYHLDTADTQEEEYVEETEVLDEEPPVKKSVRELIKEDREGTSLGEK